MITQALPSSDPMRPRLFTVATRRDETFDTFTFTLRPHDGRPAAFASGQFNMLYLFGRGEVPISMSGDPADSSQLMHTVRNAGSVTRGFATLAVGDTVGIRGPFGSSWPMAAIKGHNVIFLAGGLGLAPLRPALLHALAHRSDYGDLTVLYGTRNPKALLFADDIADWAASPALTFLSTVDHADAAWQGQVGVITKLIARIGIDPARTAALICGPEIMMHFAVEALKGRDLPGSSIYVSLERNMKCAIGHCGHCQLGSAFLCRDGPVFRHDRISHLLRIPRL